MIPRLVKISLKRLYEYWQEHPLVMILYTVSGILSVLCILFVYPEIMPHMSRDSGTNANYRYFRYILSEPSTDYETLTELMHEFHIPAVTVSLECPHQKEGTICEVMSLFSFKEQHDETELSRVLSSLKQNEVLVPDMGDRPRRPGESLRIWKDDPHHYQVRTTWDEVRYGLHPDTYRDRYGFDFIAFYVEERLVPEASKNIDRRFESAFQVRDVRSPDDVYRSEDETRPLSLTVMATIFILGVISYVFLLLFLIKEQATSNRIYRMIGLSFGQGYIIQTVDVLIMSMMHALMGSLLHRLSWRSVFRPLSRVSPEVLSWQDYLFVTLFTSIIALAVLLPYALAQYRQSLAQYQGVEE